MLAVLTPEASHATFYVAAYDSAFRFEKQGRLLRSRSISGLSYRSLLFRRRAAITATFLRTIGDKLHRALLFLDHAVIHSGMIPLSFCVRAPT